MTRKYRMVHDPMLIRWLMANYPFGTWKMNVRLGSVREEIKKGILEKYAGITKVYRFTADAVITWDRKVSIVECVVRPGEYYKIQQLNTYERQFKVTEEYRKYWDWPIEKILLTTEVDPVMNSEAARSGIRVVKFTTPDIEIYKQSLRKGQIIPRGSGLKPI